jgi:hypothetical protein
MNYICQMITAKEKRVSGIEVDELNNSVRDARELFHTGKE